MNANRCIWSNRADPGTRPVEFRRNRNWAAETYWVCPAHEAEFRRFHARQHRQGAVFLTALGLTVAVGLVLSVFDGAAVAALTLIGVGLIVVVFPFATPQTVRLLGVRTSIQVVRVLGLLMLGAGVFQASRLVLA